MPFRPLPGIERLSVGGRRPGLPSGVRIYAVGDIHGRNDLLCRLLADIDRHATTDPVVRPIYVFLGDYLDRGPASRETIDRLIDLGATQECVFLKGNHEQFAIRCLSDRSLFDQWMRLGGMETLISYGVPRDSLANGRSIAELQAIFHNSLPQTHLRFFRDMQSSFACGDFFFAHAGVNPETELELQKESDLLWIRDEFLSSTRDFGKVVVHGHTPTQAVDVLPNRINIDTGAFATGRLTCLAIEEENLSVLDTA